MLRGFADVRRQIEWQIAEPRLSHGRARTPVYACGVCGGSLARSGAQNERNVPIDLDLMPKLIFDQHCLVFVQTSQN
jgi:hypothetical protein